MSKWHKNWFSNMLPFDQPLIEDGISYRTPEHYYQAHKLNDLTKRKEIAQMGPFEAKKALQDKETYCWRPDWTYQLKLSVMETALRWKFGKGTSWYTKLMETGQEKIVEWNNWNDLWWGKDLETKKGRNELGKLLMKIRSEFQFKELFGEESVAKDISWGDETPNSEKSECPFCKELSFYVKERHRNTAYCEEQDHLNYMISCDKCYKVDYEYHDALWKECRSSQW